MVDLIWLAGLEDWLASEGMEDSASCVHEAAKEIDILRKQLAEAKRQAIPWRDGPARGGKSPSDGIVFMELILDADTVVYHTGYLMTSGKNVRTLEGVEGVFRVCRWCPSSEIPAEPEKAKVKP